MPELLLGHILDTRQGAFALIGFRLYLASGPTMTVAFQLPFEQIQQKMPWNAAMTTSFPALQLAIARAQCFQQPGYFAGMHGTHREFGHRMRDRHRLELLPRGTTKYLTAV